MSASSRKAPLRKAIRRLELLADEGNSDKGEPHSKDSATSDVLGTSTGEETRSKFVQSVAEIIEKIAKERQDVAVTQKRSEFHQEIEKKRRELVPFGPFYIPGSDSISQAKDAAWKHVVWRSGAQDERDYKLSLKNIENGALEMYGIPVKDKPKPEQFRTMMVKDGCFFLQLALHILGGGDLLRYPEDHLYFGKDKDTAIWIPDMFFMGNQIPYEVIEALMKQTFFRNVINNGIQDRIWYCPDEENIAKMALYLVVVKPAFWSHFQENPPPPQFRETPSNILECLHNLFLGNRARDVEDSKTKEFEGLEAGSYDDNIKVPSAGDLSKSGIKLATNTRLQWLSRLGINLEINKRLELLLSKLSVNVATNRRPGIKNIRFRNLGYCAKIYLPTLTIHSHTKDILTSLVKYEQKNMNESDRDLTAYLQFMRDLVRTYDDLKILEEKRIIVVKDAKLKGKIIHMFEDLSTLHNSNSTLTFRHIRKKITDYGGPPWRLISFILGILTFISTIFTILAYVHPLN